MPIRVALSHTTRYEYDRPVIFDPHVIRLRPAPHCRTPIVSYALRVEPEPHFLNWQQDPYNNYQARIVFPEPAREFKVTVDLVAEMVAINPFDFFIAPEVEKYPFAYEPALAGELAPYRECEPAGPRLTELARSFERHDMRTIDFLVDINRHLQKSIKYGIRFDPGVQTCEETLALASGSCRDTAWLFVQLLRQLGLAARFVSGYLIQLTADEKSLDGPSGPEQDFTDLHAWTEVYLPGAGWVGFDATSGLVAGEGHIPLACAAHPITAAPITGSYHWLPSGDNGQIDKIGEKFDFQMSLARVFETPRVTLPYTEAQWRSIDALGNRIDEELRQGDVHLTMGGEPTFVSIDDRDGPEWNFDALGPGKTRQAGVLLKRLRDRFAPGALLHYGQGKWYPGESLPRWVYGCYWRRDGVPLWENPALVGDTDANYGHNSACAQQFAIALAERLGVDPDFCLPSYEDIWYYLWRERRLPSNVDPLENKLEEPEERRRLSRVFEQGLDHVVGYVLPLRRQYYAGVPRWESGQWLLRREHVFLIPGDSPMGLRLPLDSLPWEVPDERQQVWALDPLAPRGPLPRRPGYDRHPQIAGITPGARRAPSMNGAHGAAPRAPSGIVRTALCIEPREGRLHTFMPPVDRLEDYLDLVAAIEATAAELETPVLLEGYKPPSDHRLNHFQITPDPGVIEVNVHPAHNWRELVHNTTVLYEEARLARLSTEKFMLDGRHTGTGGGNHVVLGGPTPALSPILRRPDLLRSLVACWHNHPALSYLFSSLFIGPTSQAPRVDEARNDALYELELAFTELPNHGDCPPWIVDRVLRNLLVDITGNTHRAEFCIDKLFSPDSADGRRGLVELRAFEMPPHARMSLVQQLLIRALVARFWKSGYDQRLVRWGTELHDRFMLPHFVEQDLDDLLYELGAAGYPLEKAWFAPHVEFRFPWLGSVAQQGVEFELRQAIEPWHVLGEEVTGSGTARYVDSSVERLQVKVRGLIDTRHVVTCNGRRVPLHPTGTVGEFVAGVRYRAWCPPSCLHPTIGIDAPLVFDIYDTWNERSIGGCQYHVSHPGGLAYEVLPVNSREAESRRYNRFIRFGHTPGRQPVVAEPRRGEFPLTLDLRQPLAAERSAAHAKPHTGSDPSLARLEHFGIVQTETELSAQR
ncbi:MAG: transglutaminase family protein [Pirellulales bacterium]|nr:transglutaminase family protein [Pirellulales bacterium]